MNAQIVTINYGLQEGLPSSETFFGYQDDSNYLWFTTDRGIVRYDGYEFKTFTTKDGLAELVNLKVLKDPRGGFIMIGKSSKITLYRDGRFHAFQFNDTLTHLSEKYKFRLDILDISKSKILLNDLSFTRQYYYEVNRNTGEVNRIHASHLKSVDWSSASRIPLDIDSIYSKDGFVIIDRFPSEYADNYSVHYQNSSNQYIFSESQHRKIKLPYGSKFGYQDRLGNIWFTKDQKLLFKPERDETPQVILDNVVSSVLEDKDGNIWAMSPANGLSKIKKNTFLKSLDIVGFNDRVVDIFDVGSILKFYTSSINNYNRYNFKDTLLYSEINNTAYTIQGYKVSDSVKLYDKFDFAQIDTNLNAVRNFHSKSEVLNYSSYGKYYIIEKYGNIHILNSKNYDLVGITLPYTYDFEEASGKYLFGTTEGLKIGKFENFNDSTFRILDTTYINNRINDLDKGPNEDVWIATLERGVFRYHEGKIRKVINPFHSFQSINTLEVLDSIAFIGTSTGLNKISYDVVNDSVIIRESQFVGITGGLSPPYIKSLEFHRDFILVGTLEGILTFHVDSFRLNESIPELYLNGIFQKNQKLIPENPFIYNLKSTNNFFTIKYTGISYTKDPVIPFYRYSFHADDSTRWIYTQSRDINFSDIAPGKYTFTVQCRNNANEWSDPASLFINIHPPFFQTWTFRIGSLVVIGGLIWTFFYFRSRNLKRQQAIKNEILSVQMQSTRSQMNPHFVFNGMNAIQNYIFSGDKEGANRYITTFSSLLRDSLHMANKEYISLDQEVGFVERYLSLEKKRFPDKFDYEVTVSTDIPEEKVLVPTLMVQTLAENAVKHAFKGMEKKGNINIHYHYKDEIKLLTIKIVDDGVGILNRSQDQSKNADSSNFGLNLLRRRIDIYNERITDKRKATFKFEYLDPKNKIGTKISLNIPLYENGD